MAHPRRIADLQNSDRVLMLQRGIAVAHRYTLLAQAFNLAVSVVVAALSLLAQTMPGSRPAVAAVGAVWAAVYTVYLAPLSSRSLRTSATLQEMLDVGLFRLPWNAVVVGDAVPEDEVSRLARRFRGDERWLRDYYLVADVPEPYDVLFCLEQNLAWGSRVRQRYAQLLAGIAAVWCVIGIVVGIVGRLTVTELAGGWFVPSLGLLLLCLDTYRAQVSVTRERTRVVGLLRTRMTEPAASVVTPGPEWTEFARRIQDVLFQLRRLQPRVPLWFFRRSHDADLADFRFKMQDLEAKVNSATTISP